MEGCSAPLVVKFADTQKEKEQKKIQQLHWSVTPNNISTPLTHTPASMTTPILANPPQQTSPFIATDAINPAASLQLLQQLQAVGLQQHLLQGSYYFLMQITLNIYVLCACAVFLCKYLF